MSRTRCLLTGPAFCPGMRKRKKERKFVPAVQSRLTRAWTQNYICRGRVATEDGISTWAAAYRAVREGAEGGQTRGNECSAVTAKDWPASPPAWPAQGRLCPLEGDESSLARRRGLRDVTGLSAVEHS